MNEVREMPRRHPVQLGRIYKKFKRSHYEFDTGLYIGFYRICMLANFFFSWIAIQEFITNDELTWLQRDPIKIINMFSLLWPVCMVVYDKTQLQMRRLKEKKQYRIKKFIVLTLYYIMLLLTYI